MKKDLSFGVLCVLIFVINLISRLFRTNVLEESKGAIGLYYIGSGEIWVKEGLPKAVRASIEYHEHLHKIFFEAFPWYWDFAETVYDFGGYFLMAGAILITFRWIIIEKDLLNNHLDRLKIMEKIFIGSSVFFYFLAYLSEFHAYTLQLVSFPMWFVVHNLTSIIIMVFYPLILYLVLDNLLDIRENGYNDDTFIRSLRNFFK